ncbi:hypothetical protein RHMOL_Rhmol10G0181300 [Rhododendron molle]|uniref:Uncharacterized protein n=1 Tax=Rhododendron molle TaxID=49168 RepID=A0ACC0M3U9_RHOML|nr:hypothetical protein RHMOL_Rhmol10G0181300 [Rhododendron molle]
MAVILTGLSRVKCYHGLGKDGLAGTLRVGCELIFCLEWVVLTLAFFLKYYAYVEGDDLSKRSAKVQQVEDDMKNWPWPFLVWT